MQGKHLSLYTFSLDPLNFGGGGLFMDPGLIQVLLCPGSYAGMTTSWILNHESVLLGLGGSQYNAGVVV